MDGFNAYFFKKVCQIINDEVCAAVKEFFTAGRLYKVIDGTTLMLISKVDKPDNVKDFRPIACCTLLNKIISKVLASRLTRLLHSSLVKIK